MAAETELKNKLTLKMLDCDPKAVLSAKDGRLPLARMYGEAFKIGTQKHSDTGQEYTFFGGMFEGVNLQTGEVVQAPRLYLPGHISDMLENVISEVQDRHGKGSRVGFAIEIYAVKTGKTRSGYGYEAQWLQKPTMADQLQKFRELGKPIDVRKDRAAAKSA